MSSPTPIYETQIPFEAIDRVIKKVYPVIADEPAPNVIAAMIAMIVMAMNPNAPPQKLIQQIEDISQFITLNILTPPADEIAVPDSNVTLN